MKAIAAALSLALLVLSVEGLAAAQDQPPPKPTFKSAVDLVPVDVSVIDKKGFCPSCGGRRMAERAAHLAIGDYRDENP